MFKTLRAILAQHRRLSDVEAALEEVRHELSEFRADLDWLAGEIKKLRGRITGGSRRPTDAGHNGAADTPEGAASPTAAELNALILAGRGVPKRR